MSLVQPQPEPRKNDNQDIWLLVIQDMEERRRFGLEKYGTPLQIDNGRDHLMDAYQENLDQSAYLRQEIERRKQPVENIAKQPTPKDDPWWGVWVVLLIGVMYGAFFTYMSLPNEHKNVTDQWVVLSQFGDGDQLYIRAARQTDGVYESIPVVDSMKGNEIRMFGDARFLLRKGVQYKNPFGFRWTRYEPLTTKCIVREPK